MSAEIRTDWYRLANGEGDHENLEKHDRYKKHVRGLASRYQPWLFPLLDACNAIVYCGPHFFAYQIDAHHPGVLFGVPEMARMLGLTPFVGDNEKPH